MKGVVLRFSPARGTPAGAPLLRSDPSAGKGGMRGVARGVGCGGGGVSWWAGLYDGFVTFLGFWLGA